jgi:hypothetical protein
MSTSSLGRSCTPNIKPSCVRRYRYGLKPGADRHPNDRQEEDIEQLEMMLFCISEHEGERGKDGGQLGGTLGREFRDAPASEEDQGKRCDHRDADHVAHPEAKTGGKEIVRRQQTRRDQNPHVARCNEGGANRCDKQQEKQVAHRRERRIETHRWAHQEGQGRRITTPDDGRRHNLEWPSERQLPHDEIGQQRPEK